MKKFKNWFLNNLMIILCFIITMVSIIYSFSHYIFDYYGYDYDALVKGYEQAVESCNTKVITDEEFCDDLTYPLTPLESFKLLDVNTLFFEVCYHYIGFFFVMVFPLLVMIIFLSKTHKDFKSGAVRNFLMREPLKRYKYLINKRILKIAIILPLSILFMYIISCLLTRFNFNVNPRVYLASVYIEWNYDHIFLYLIIIYVVYFLLCIYYCNIACFFVNKNKNIFIVTILSYICWFVIVFVVNILSFKFIPQSMIRFFNILDYWSLRHYVSQCWYGFILGAFVLAFLSFIVREILFRKKERIIIENEKGII